MGQVDYNSFKQRTTQNNSNGNSNNRGPRVGYFTLRQDKDQAIVRFMIDSPDDFDIVAGHRMPINGFNRMVNCVRDVHDPVENCPLCAAGKKLEYRIYIHLIEYTRDEEGRIVSTPKVWERSTAYINTLTNLLNEYGPLSDNVFKITRNGAAGTTGTTYDITYCRPEIYKPELYVKNESLFNGYKAVGNAVLDYDVDKLNELVSGAATTETAPTRKEEQPVQDYAPKTAPTTEAPSTAYSTTTPRTAPTYSGQDSSQSNMPGRRFY